MPELTQKFAELPVEHAFRNDMAEDGMDSATHQFVLPQYGLASFYHPTQRVNGRCPANLV